MVLIKNDKSNVINGEVYCSAKIIKESEKAIYVRACCEYNEEYYHFNMWLPKSQIVEGKRDEELLYFLPKNNWILGAKFKDYAKYRLDVNPTMWGTLRDVALGRHNPDVDYVEWEKGCNA